MKCTLLLLFLKVNTQCIDLGLNAIYCTIYRICDVLYIQYFNIPSQPKKFAHWTPNSHIWNMNLPHQCPKKLVSMDLSYLPLLVNFVLAIVNVKEYIWNSEIHMLLWNKNVWPDLTCIDLISLVKSRICLDIQMSTNFWYYSSLQDLYEKSPDFVWSCASLMTHVWTP